MLNAYIYTPRNSLRVFLLAPTNTLCKSPIKEFLEASRIMVTGCARKLRGVRGLMHFAKREKLFLIETSRFLSTFFFFFINNPSELIFLPDASRKSFFFSFSIKLVHDLDRCKNLYKRLIKTISNDA